MNLIYNLYIPVVLVFYAKYWGEVLYYVSEAAIKIFSRLKCPAFCASGKNYESSIFVFIEWFIKWFFAWRRLPRPPPPPRGPTATPSRRRTATKFVIIVVSRFGAIKSVLDADSLTEIEDAEETSVNIGNYFSVYNSLAGRVAVIEIFPR